jgi:hypothetical protein
MRATTSHLLSMFLSPQRATAKATREEVAEVAEVAEATDVVADAALAADPEETKSFKRDVVKMANLQFLFLPTLKCLNSLYGVIDN